MNFGKIKTESTAAKFIPFAAHLSESIISTKQGDYICVFRLSGASFETIDDVHLNNFHNRLNNLYKNISSPYITLFQHIVRRKASIPPETGFTEATFAHDFCEMYTSKLLSEQMFINELYLTILYRPESSFFDKLLLKNISRFPRLFAQLGVSSNELQASIQIEQKKACEFLQKISSVVETSLQRYDPSLLKTYEHKGHVYSEPLEFFGYLVNGEFQQIPLPQGPLDSCLLTSRPMFGSEAFELRMPTQSKFGAVLGIKEYPASTWPGFLNQTLLLPFEFVLVQSFAFEYKESAKTKIKIQRNRLQNAQDDSISQIEALDGALDDVTSNVFSLGHHHFNMFVFGSSLKEVNEHFSQARAALADGGMIVTREDAANEAAFWAQLPGNFALRPRVATINSRNFAAAAPFHNYPTGRAFDNHWGPSLLTLKTASGAPYFFSYHASDPLDPSGGSRKDVGHTVILGPSGSGKTVFTNTTMIMLEKVGATKVALTKDYDSALTIMATGGTYLPIRYGKRTGFNPFALPDTPENRAFLGDFLRQILQRPDQAFTPAEELELARALDIVMSLPHEQRQLQRLAEGLNMASEHGLFVRLQKWIHDGEFAWAFDNENDTVIDVIDHSTNLGFDITDFLDNPILKTPIGMYLLHLINKLVDGRKFALFISEFWKLLSDPYFAFFAKDQLKTIRKKNGIVILDSQEISDALSSGISTTLIEQTATKILFPNPDARKDDYQGTLNCTEREFYLIKEGMEIGQRQFLVKQGRHSVVCQLDLKGERYFLDIVSTRKANLEIVHAIQHETGFEPQKWLPVFQKRYE